MLQPARERPEPDRWQTVRILLRRCRQDLEEITERLAGLPEIGGQPTLQRLGHHSERAIRAIDEEHALIDLRLLLAVQGTWQHPVQAIARPRACYGKVAAACARLLETVQEPAEQERLERTQKRLLVAHEIHQTARSRRLALSCWSEEDDETAPETGSET